MMHSIQQNYNFIEFNMSLGSTLNVSQTLSSNQKPISKTDINFFHRMDQLSGELK